MRYEDKYRQDNVIRPVHERIDWRFIEPTATFSKLPVQYEGGIRYCFDKILAEWPAAGSKAADTAKEGLVTAYTFYHEHFRSMLRRVVRLQFNKVDPSFQYPIHKVVRYSLGEEPGSVGLDGRKKVEVGLDVLFLSHRL